LDGLEISDTLGRMKRALWLTSALVLLAGCSQTPTPAVAPRESDVSLLRKAQEAAIEAFASRNADHMVSAYSADASLMFPNSPILQGEDLRTAIRALAADPNFSIQFSTDRVEVAKSGEIGYTRGTYTMTMSDRDTKKVLREKGKYVTIYSRQADGSWKMMEDISNADAPASAK
jgi:ketosteroid isomerase-like protein